MLRVQGEVCEIRTIKTTGDMTDRPLLEIGGKGLFVKEIEEALLRGEIDLAVHSMKDVPADIPSGLLLTAFPKREDPRDVFLSKKFRRLVDLPQGARIGTSSPRRLAQLKDWRGDLSILPIRGNVDTRIAKLERGEFDAIILAAAGLVRLGRANEITEYLPIEKMIPSVGQGVLALETRVDDDELKEKLHRICHHEETALAVKAERAFLKKIGGDCYTPLAAYAELKNERITMTAYLGHLNGGRGYVDHHEASINEAEELGRCLADRLLQKRDGDLK
jgi:hydroxymethylbilane synthase